MSRSIALQAVLAAILILALQPLPVNSNPCPSCTDGFDVGFRDALRVTSMAGDGQEPCLAVDGDTPGSEKIYIAWVDASVDSSGGDPQGDSEIWLAASFNGGCSFSDQAGLTPKRLTFNATDDTRPSIGYDERSGVVALVYERGKDIYLLRSTDGGGSFEPEIRLNARNDGLCANPTLSLSRTLDDSALHLHAAWEVNQSGAGKLFFRRNLNGGASPDWRGMSGPDEEDLTAAYLSGSQAWSPWLAADASSSGPAETAVSLVCLSDRDDPAGGVVFSRSLDSGGSFSGDVTSPATPPLRLDTFQASSPAQPSIASRPSVSAGDIWEGVVWKAERDQNPQVPTVFLDAQSEEGVGPSILSRWNNPAGSNDIEARRNVDILEAPAVALLDDSPMAPPAVENLLFALWVESSTGQDEVWGNRWGLDRNSRPNIQSECGAFQVTGLSPPRTDPATEAGQPRAVGHGPDLFVVWADNRDGAYEIYFTRTDQDVPAPDDAAATVSACPDAAAVDLAWTAGGCDVRYRVTYGTVSGSPILSIDVGLTDQYTLRGLNQNTLYYIEVIAEDKSCNSAGSGEIEVTTPQCFEPDLIVNGTTFQDSCIFGGAGGDGSIDPGERITLTVGIENRGTLPASGVQAVLSAMTPGVTVITGTSDYGNLPVGPPVNGPAFVFDVSRTVPCGTPILLLMEIAAAEGSFSQHLAFQIPAACTECYSAACDTGADASATDGTPVCRGTRITLDGTNSAPVNCGGDVLYDWYRGATYIGPGIQRNVTPTSSGTYTLVATCTTDFSCTSSDGTVLTIYQLPQITIDESPPPFHCIGDSVTLTASTPDPAATYTWNTGENQAGIVVTDPGTYTVSVVDTNSCSNNRPIRVEFWEHPPAGAGPDVTVCRGESILLGTPPYNGLGYAWSPPDDLDDVFSPRPLATPAVTTTYTLTVTDLVTDCESQDSVTLTVSPDPGRIAGLMAVRTDQDVIFSWDAGADASGGYHLYHVRVEEELPSANMNNTAAIPACQTDLPLDLTCSHAGAVEGPPANPGLLFYQVVGVCGADVLEGPN